MTWLRSIVEISLCFSLMLGTIFLPNLFLKRPMFLAFFLFLALFLLINIQPIGKRIIKRVYLIFRENYLGFFVFFTLLFLYAVEITRFIPDLSRILVLIAATFFLFSIPIFIVYVSKLNSIKKIVRGYVFFSLYMAITGIIAFLLFYLEIANVDDWKLSLSEVTGNPAAGDEINFFPYSLGMVTISNATFDIFGFVFPRASGLASESSLAAIFIGPSLYFIKVVFKKRGAIFLSYSLIFIFLLICFSVTWVVLFTFLNFLQIILKKKYGRLICYSILLFLLVLLYRGTSGKSGEKDIFVDKFQSSSSTDSMVKYGLGMFYTDDLFGSGFFDKEEFSIEKNTIGIIPYFILYLHVFFVLVISYKNIISKNRYISESGLILLYLTMFMFRNLHSHYLWTPFYIFFLFYAIYIRFVSQRCNIINPEIQKFENNNKLGLLLPGKA